MQWAGTYNQRNRPLQWISYESVFHLQSQKLRRCVHKCESHPVNTLTCAAFTAHDPPQYYWPALSHIPLPLWNQQSHYRAAGGQLVLTTSPTPTQSLWLGNSGRLARCTAGGCKTGGAVGRYGKWVMLLHWLCSENVKICTRFITSSMIMVVKQRGKAALMDFYVWPVISECDFAQVTSTLCSHCMYLLEK